MIETIEHNNRFYTNEKGEIKTENDQLKEWLIIANKEIERLNKEIEQLRTALNSKESIIKEVREYINKNFYWSHNSIEMANKAILLHLNNILEILDKENNNEDN